MTQLTIGGFADELLRRVHLLAESEGLSLNQAALKLMRWGAGLGNAVRSYQIGNGLSKLWHLDRRGLS